MPLQLSKDEPQLEAVQLVHSGSSGLMQLVRQLSMMQPTSLPKHPAQPEERSDCA